MPSYRVWLSGPGREAHTTLDEPPKPGDIVAIEGGAVARVDSVAAEVVSATRLESCVECGRLPEPGGTLKGWRYYSDGTGELVPYCAGCAEQEFGPA